MAKSIALAPVSERPAFLTEYDGDRTGTEGLARIVRPSFVKIVQKMSASDLIESFGVGSVILTPDMQLLTKGGEENGVAFVPILHYAEYCKWSSIRLRGMEPMIVERSFDPASQVAIKSQSQATWSERHPNYPNDEKYNYRYCEHANFLVKLWEPDLRDLDPVLISFSRSNFGAGGRLAKLIMGRHAVLWAGVYSLTTRLRKGKESDYPVFAVSNNASDVGQWVSDPETFEQLKELHVQFAELLKARTLDVQYHDEDALDPDQVVEEANY